MSFAAQTRAVTTLTRAVSQLGRAADGARESVRDLNREVAPEDTREEWLARGQSGAGQMQGGVTYKDLRTGRSFTSLGDLLNARRSDIESTSQAAKTLSLDLGDALQKARALKEDFEGLIRGLRHNKFVGPMGGNAMKHNLLQNLIALYAMTFAVPGMEELRKKIRRAIPGFGGSTRQLDEIDETADAVTRGLV